MSETEITHEGATTPAPVSPTEKPPELTRWVDALDPSLRRSLGTLTSSAALWSVWFYTVNSAAFSQYAKGLGVQDWGFGIIAAMASAASIFQWPGSYIIEKTRRRKPLFLTAGIVHRLAWILIAAIPWIWPEKSGWPWLLIGLYGVSQLGANMLSPAWVVWMSDLVPREVRGRYFTFRMQFARIVGIPVSLGIGWMMDRAGVLDLSQTLSILLAVTAVFGVGDVLCYNVLVDEPKGPIRPAPRWHALLVDPLRDRDFRLFLAFVFTHNLAMGYVTQYVWRYLLDVVQLKYIEANVLLITLPLLASMFTAPIWAKLVDRLGCRPVLLISGLLIVHGSAAWIFVTREHWVWGYLASMTATIAWPGIDLGLQNMLMRISSSHDHGRGSSAYVAVYAMVVAIGGVLSGLLGAGIAGALHDWTMTVWGWVVTYHGLLFLISAGLRLVSLVWLIGLHERHAWGARESLRYMAGGVYSNVQFAVSLPMRGAGRLTRLTYRLRGGEKRK